MSTYQPAFCNITTDLAFIEPNIAEYDGKRSLPGNFTTTNTSNLYQLNNTGFIDQLYKDGVEMTSVTDTPNADNEYNYSASTDSVQFFLASSSVSALNSSVFEASQDWATLKTEAVNRASDFVRSYLPFPIYPNKGVGTADATGSDFPEIIVRSTAIMAVESLVRPYDFERAEQIKSQAMNDEETGFLDRLRKGEITLYQSEDESKYRGILRPVSINANTTGGIVDIKGKSSYSWDVIKIIITNGGLFTAGVENTTVKFSSFVGNENGLKLEQMASDEIIDGYWQLVGHNMYVRFSPGLYTTSDEFELEVSGHIDQRLSAIKTVSTSRY
tara:strand:+ start:936 stop:1922 length:987 start_codon:yes stop_codon:yes gene_type:complete